MRSPTPDEAAVRGEVAGGAAEPSKRVHAVGDIVVIAAFVLLGMAEHRTAGDALGALRNLVVFLGTWTSVAWVIGLYRHPGASGALSWRLAVTWLVAVSGGILVRALIVGRSLDRGQLVFAGVALALTGTGLLGWRLAYAAVRRFPRPAAPDL